MKYRTIGTNLNREYRNDLNWNFQKIAEDIERSDEFTTEMKEEVLEDLARIERESKERDDQLAEGNLEALLQSIEDAKGNANNAASNANTQAGHAKDQGDYAKSQGDYAKDQGDYAETKGDYADEKAIEADEAAGRANDEASNLDGLKTDVVSATQSANTAANEANTQAGNAQQAADSANQAADRANTAADEASTQAGNASDAANSANQATSAAQTIADNTRFINEYDPNATYSLNNFVRLDGSTFISLADNNTGNTPNPDADTNYWALSARRGLDGDGNVDSVNGKTGEVEINKEDVGLGNVGNVEQAPKSEFDTHVSDNARHITEAERNNWNGKADVSYVDDSVDNIEVPVTSVNGKTGDIDLKANDVGALSEQSGKIEIGEGAEVEGDSDSLSIAIGFNAKVPVQASEQCTALGAYAEAMGISSVSIGDESSTLNPYSLAIGYRASTEEGHAAAIGVRSVAENDGDGVIGHDGVGAGAHKWIVPGTFTVGGTKNFEMPHPHPDKKHTHRLRHAAVESPTAGDNLYRYTVEATADNETVEMELPDYFQYLNKDVDVWVNGHNHFGRAFGNVEGNTLKVTCELKGEYKVLVIGTRNDDHQSVQDWDIKGVEREIGESWTGETYAFSVNEIMEVEEIKEVI